MKYEIVRENNKWNKSLRWHLMGQFLTGGNLSLWYKTRQEAEWAVNRMNANNASNKYCEVNR